MQTTVESNKNKPRGQYVVPEEHRKLLKEVAVAVAAIGRLDTAQAFERCRQLSRAKAVLPEKSFGKWIKQDCGLTTRQGWNYIILQRFDEQQQEQLVAAAVKPTVMATLATAEAAKMAELLTRIGGGEHFTVAQIKQLVKADLPKKAPAAVGGTAGLLRVANAKLKAESDMFGKIAKVVLKAVEQVTADLQNGKHVAKTTLAEKVESQCQKASALLRSVIEPVQSVAVTPKDWEKARQIISRLGDSPRWPGRSAFPVWVTDQVLPALRFVVHGTPISGEQTGSVGALKSSAVDRGDDNLSEVSTINNGAETIATPASPGHRSRLAATPALAPDQHVLTLATLDGETFILE